MLDRTIARAIKDYISARRAFLEVTTGPKIRSSRLDFGQAVAGFSIGPIGNQHHVVFGASLLKELGIPTDAKFHQLTIAEGRNFNSANVMAYVGLDDTAFEQATRGFNSYVNQNRHLLELYTGGFQRPILRIQWVERKLGYAEFKSPDYRGLSERAADDLISPDFLRSASASNDEQFHYFISILSQIHQTDDELFKIARYFSLLEGLTSALRSQFERQTGKQTVTRAAIRYALKYFVDYDIPRFTIEPNEVFEFDHIELAGRLRHKLFHGGGSLTAKDAGEKLAPALPLLEKRPDMISHRLRRDCEILIAQRAASRGIAWRALNGEAFEMPARNPDYDGRELAKCLINSQAAKRSAIGSVLVKVAGGDIGLIKMNLVGFENLTPE